MFKWEKNLNERIDRYLPQLVWVLVTLIALFIRRGGLWHISFDFQNQFYTDEIGYLHTPFYTMFIWLVSHIPVTPIRTVKMIISLFDFGVAAAAVVLIRDRLVGQGRKADIKKLLTCYALLLISPVVIENGLTWIHMDSICFFMVLCAAIALGRKKNMLAWILLGAAAALQMQYGVIFIAVMIGWSVKRRAAGPAAEAAPEVSAGQAASAAQTVATQAGAAGPAAGLAVIAVLNVIAGIWSGTDCLTGLYQLVNWLVIDPGTGEVLGSLLIWLASMAAQYGYLIAVSTLIAVFLYTDGGAWESDDIAAGSSGHKKIRCGTCLIWTVAICHVVLTIYLGWILQQ